MLYGLTKNVVGPLARLVFRPSIEGLENIPKSGPVILASNHLSVVDSLVIPLVLPRRVAILAKAEYFEGKTVRGRLLRWFLGSLGHIPVRRGHGRAAKDALQQAERVLLSGGAFAIYPEGTRSTDGRMYRGRTGVGRLALNTGAPVVPIALSGTEDVQPIGRRFPRIRPITVRFGPAMDFSRYDGMATSLPIQRAVTDEVVYRILELSGAEYVDSYRQAAA
ncbi:lysophospholipid acyltransferase family protein [Actinoalloteichus hymeniacidonis]|uniref:1-acyl-sn-glycerol-3-phosphate acyltransferase n=1 Tax=Actinoalloteichus hymeniacidonis TaxID=340345 RepID=A0AAC9HNK2_9PSEU|nr:lysophospholipid acyltransferase family protein [Actinoalloteichus hymeniacidonis]AOS62478.1 1-acyl-sn-glycerol-3-phosphate acyltransferase [Actinoalloteichus hymeniacidonis]MBB5909491.1 1-acyl-sn-glycerol-3-phosphate acyltransferase [Actinoalloteichus hymeniacidonis]